KAWGPWTPAVTAGIEGPAVVRALQPPALHPSPAQPHPPVRADVLQGANPVFVIPKKHERAAGQTHANGFGAQSLALQHWVPVIENAHELSARGIILIQFALRREDFMSAKQTLCPQLQGMGAI